MRWRLARSSRWRPRSAIRAIRAVRSSARCGGHSAHGVSGAASFEEGVATSVCLQVVDELVLALDLLLLLRYLIDEPATPCHMDGHNSSEGRGYHLHLLVMDGKQR